MAHCPLRTLSQPDLPPRACGLASTRGLRRIDHLAAQSVRGRSTPDAASTGEHTTAGGGYCDRSRNDDRACTSSHDRTGPALAVGVIALRPPHRAPPVALSCPPSSTRSPRSGHGTHQESLGESRRECRRRQPRWAGASWRGERGLTGSAAAGRGAAAFACVAGTGGAHLGAARHAEWRVGRLAEVQFHQLSGGVRGADVLGLIRLLLRLRR